MAVWFTSDTHFQHKLISTLRGYELDGPKSIHVGWDAWHRPVHLDEIREMMGLE
jgi:calcineurin-like phosphoesterase family protein